MKRSTLAWFLPPALVLTGCLPAFDNFKQANTNPDLAGADLSGPQPDLAQPPCSGSSGTSVTVGSLFLMDKLAFSEGGQLRLEGCEATTPGPGVAGPPTQNGIQILIPKDYADQMLTKFVIAEGPVTYPAGTATLARNWFAPPLKMGSGNTGYGVIHPSTNMGGVRDRVKTELAGKLDGDNFNVAYGWLGLAGEPVNDVKQTKFSLDTTANPAGNADQAACMPNAANNCCVYYARHFDVAFAASPMPLLVQGATQSDSGFFAIVCHDDGMGEMKPPITVTQTASTIKESGGSDIPASLFPPFQVPRVRGPGLAIIEYFVTL